MRFLFVDRIVDFVPGQRIYGLKHITPDDPFLYRNEEGQLCFMSSLIGETLGQLAAWNVMFTNDFTFRPVAGIVSSARPSRPVFVGETLLLESHIDSLDDSAVQYHSIARVGTETVFTIESALGPLLPMKTFIGEDEIKTQFAEINRPGDWETLCAGSVSETPFYPRQLPDPQISMTFDRVLNYEPGVSITAEKRITRSAPYFPDHFPRRPVLPLTVLLECKISLAGIFVQKAGLSRFSRIQELRKIKMSEFVFPGDIVQCCARIHQQDEDTLILRYQSTVDGKKVCVVDIVLTAEGYSHD